MNLLSELKRRKVLRVAAAYIVTAWLIVQVVETLFPIYGLSDAAVRVIVNVLAIGLIPVLVLSWVFEWTPQGLKRDSELDGREPVSPNAARRLDRMILVGLALALGYFAIDKFVLDARREAILAERTQEEIEDAREAGRTEALIESYGERSIAILPFANMNADPDQAYFADGIAEEILNILARVPDLRVISRSTSFTYRGDLNLQQVAKYLGVTYVLEGSVRKAGNRFRITAQLIDGRTDSHVWSETFDRDGGDIFAIQDELAAAVADALHVRLKQDRGPRHETDPESYALFLRARHIFNGYSPMDQDRSVPTGMLRTVLDRDPDYVPAMLELAHVLWYQARSSEQPIDEAKALDAERIALIQRAYSIAPDDGVANAYMRWCSLTRLHDAQAAARYIQRALEQDPTNLEVLRMASLMANLQKLDVDQVEILSRTLSRDVLCANCLAALAEAYEKVGERDKAQEIRQRRIDLVGDAAGEYVMAYSLMDTDPEAALEYFQSRPVEHGADALLPQIELLVKLGRRDEAVEVQRRLMKQGDRTEPMAIAIGFAQLGDEDSAWEWLQRALALDPEVVVFSYEGEEFPELRDTPRWRELRHQMGVSEEQLAAIEFRMPELGPQ